MTSFRESLEFDGQLALFTCSGPATVSDLAAIGASDLSVRVIDKSLKDVFNGRLLQGLVLAGPYQIPRIDACHQVPAKLIAFSEALKMSTPDENAWVHWYEDDYKYERVWKSYERFLEKLRGFAGVISPDFSTYRNMPTALKISNTFRNQLLGARLQADGLNVIPNVRLSGPESVAYALAGTPHRSTLAVSFHGSIKNPENRRIVARDLEIILDLCEPAALLVYGSDAYRLLDNARAQGISVHLFRPDTWTRSKYRNIA